MLYTVYKTTNLRNGKVYVGYHATEAPQDGYLGSGTALLRAVRKYGKDAFTKEVLFVFDNPEAMLAKERELVTAEFCARKDTYNLARGGTSGWSSLPAEDRTRIAALGNARQRELAAADSSFRDSQRAAGRRTLQAFHAEGRVPYDNWLGRQHAEETKQKMRGPRTASSEAQKGKVWVCGFGAPKRVLPAELEQHLSSGWRRGRK